MRFLLMVFSVLAVQLCAAVPALAETHVVRLYDFYYEPKDLTIQQGDTVQYVWVDAFHDAVAGNPPGFAALPYQSVFNTGLDDQLPFVKEVVFSRELLVNFPAPNNRYDYYCTPHFTQGMTGSVSVTRTAQDFSTVATSWQMLPPNSSSATADCNGTLNGDETEFSLTCTHDVAQAQGAALYEGFLGEEATKVCDLTLGESVTGSCTLTQDQANKLYDGRFSIIITSSQYPNGELRGQLTRSSTNRVISGKVSQLDGTPLSGATVSDGTRSTTTASDGSYSISEVPSGAYQLSAMKEGFLIVADEGISPVLLNSSKRATEHSRQCWVHQEPGIETAMV